VDRDVYISGPDIMIVKTVQALRISGARPELFRYDLSGEIG
jgi:NAD(P)H-flavin reductase